MTDTVQYCDRCGRAFSDDEVRYLVTINLVADFDGRLSAPRTPAGVSRLWREIEEKSDEELMSEVFERKCFILCKPCRDEWAAAPLGGALHPSPREKGSVH